MGANYWPLWQAIDEAGKLVFPVTHICYCVYRDMVWCMGIRLHSLGKTCFVYGGMCAYWHDSISLRANLGTLCKHMHLGHFGCVVLCGHNMAWCLVYGGLNITLCCKCHCISYMLHYMVRKSCYDRWLRPTAEVRGTDPRQQYVMMVCYVWWQEMYEEIMSISRMMI